MKRYLLIILTALLTSLVSSAAIAQGVITGRVTDQGGATITGATVTIEGSTAGTTTDVDGCYSISASSGQLLIFNYLGYQSQEVLVGERTSIDVVLASSTEMLDAVEVVSIGYGTAARRDLTGSVAKADMGEIMKSNITSFDQALSGRVAGVVVRSADGELGQEASITIRGNNSLTQSNSPLYVVDGFPMEESVSGILSAGDIESIDILKDASATAIYGARGANGVIVVTTKRGAEGAPRINFNASFTVDNLANKIDLMDAYEFVVLQTEMSEASGATNPYLGTDYSSVEQYRDVTGYDWQDEVYRQACTQNYSVSLAGGARAGTRYNVSMSALDQQGILQNSEYQRYQGKISLIQPINKKLDFSLNANYTSSITKGISPTTSNNSSSQSGWLIYSIWGYRPVSSDNGSGGSLLTDLTDYGVADANDYRFNPVLSAQNEIRETFMSYFNGNGALTYKLSPSLTLRSSGGYTINDRRREEFNGTYTYTGYVGSPSGKGINGLIYNYDRRTYLNENTITFKKRFGRSHNLDAVAGVSLQGESYMFDGVSATQLSTESLGVAGLYTGTAQIIEPSYEQWTMLSYFGRVNYNYLYKYYLTATMRADGSSKFPTHNRWGYFPSFGASWNFDRESWFKSVWWLSSGKLRSSWGQTGNNRTSTPYDFYDQMSTSPDNSASNDYVFNGAIVPGYYASQIANDDLKWETTTQSNIGIDLSLLDGRIKTTVDWYVKDTKDLLLDATVSSTTGYTTSMMNIGRIRNQGWEFSLETLNIATANFTWSTSFNIAFNKNRVVSLTNNQDALYSTVTWDYNFNSQYPYISQVGSSTGQMYGYQYEGTYKISDFDVAADGTYTLKDGIPYLSSYDKSKIQPGDPRYSDIDNDGYVNDSDRTVIGSGQAVHTGGFGNSFAYKGFDLNIFFTWSWGNDILNANRLIFEQGSKTNTNQLASYTERWSEDNPDSDIPRIFANGMQLYSSRVIEDGSYLRLNNISIGYTLPQARVKSWGIREARVYASLNNIHTFTSYSGPDPEVSTRNSVLTPGFDWSAYPRTIGATMGINITF